MYDDRITKKALRTDHITLTCVNHPTKKWNTKNIGGIGSRSIFFSGEAGKKTHYGMYRTFQDALRLLMDGEMVDNNGNTKEFNRETVAALCERYAWLENEYSSECPCPGSDLILDPMYENMPEVDA